MVLRMRLLHTLTLKLSIKCFKFHIKRLVFCKTMNLLNFFFFNGDINKKSIKSIKNKKQ